MAITTERLKKIISNIGDKFKLPHRTYLTVHQLIHFIDLLIEESEENDLEEENGVQ